MSVQRIRGYRLTKRNAAMREAQPLCVMCLQEGRVKAGAEWDHIVPLFKGGADDESNLQHLCVDHHRQKTARDRSTKPEIGDDGWPVEPA